MKLILIRHGFDFAGRLLPEGLEQCEAVRPYAESIMGENPLIITSTSPRAIETGSVLLGQHSIEDDAFAERDDCSKAKYALGKYWRTAGEDNRSSVVIVTHRPIIEGLLGSWVSAGFSNIFEAEVGNNIITSIRQTVPSGGGYKTEKIFPRAQMPNAETPPSPPS